MKHLKKFEDLDYRDLLAQQANLRDQMDKNIEERQELTHMIIQSLIFSEQGKEGFDNFKNDLRQLLEKYPFNKLPRSGSSIYR